MPVIENDPFGILKKEKKPGGDSPDPQIVNKLHRRSDLDSSSHAQHHTLGPQHNQASPGDHIHNGGSSKKLGAGLGLSISGAKGGNAAIASIISMLANVIEFTDNTTA